MNFEISQGSIFNHRNKKEIAIHFHSLSCKNTEFKTNQHNFSSPPVCDTETCFPWTLLPTETTLQRYIYSSPATKVLSRQWQEKQNLQLNANELKLFLQMRHLSAWPFSWREGGRRLLSIWTSKIHNQAETYSEIFQNNFRSSCLLFMPYPKHDTYL